MRTSPHITVCICTYRRPRLLSGLLTALREQRTGNQFTYSVVVVDNDPCESARSVIASSAMKSVDIAYYTEPRRNIALARNRALEGAWGDYVALIDDDEAPVDSWLERLVAACSTEQVSGVLGPVVPRFLETPPRWIEKGRFCERPRFLTGTRLAWQQTRAGNALLKRSALESLGKPWFRPQFADGGEDDDFFRRLIERGHVFTWCDEAIVFETLPAERCTRRYFVRRALQRGQNQRFSMTAVSLTKSLAACAIYALQLPFTVYRHELFMDRVIRFCDHAGKLFAACGIGLLRKGYVSSSEP